MILLKNKKSSEILTAHAGSISELTCIVSSTDQHNIRCIKKSRYMYNHMHLELSSARNGIRTRDLRLGKATLHLWAIRAHLVIFELLFFPRSWRQNEWYYFFSCLSTILLFDFLKILELFTVISPSVRFYGTERLTPSYRGAHSAGIFEEVCSLASPGALLWRPPPAPSSF